MPLCGPFEALFSWKRALASLPTGRLREPYAWLTRLCAALSRRRGLSAEAERHQGVHVRIVQGRELRSFGRVGLGRSHALGPRIFTGT